MTVLNTHIPLYAPLSNKAALSYSGSVIGALALSGVEPVTLSRDEKRRLTQLLRSVIQRLPFECSLTQYYWHSKCEPIQFKDRASERANFISQRRAKFLNEKRDLYVSSLYWVIEIKNTEDYNDTKGDLIVSLFQAVFDRNHREKIKRKLSMSDALILEEKRLTEQMELLDEVLNNMELGLSFRSFDNERVDSNQLFNLQKSIVNLSPEYLKSDISAPALDWDCYLSNVNVEPVIVDGVHYLKIEGSEPVYARIASVIGCGIKSIPESAWVADCSPVLEKGSYLFFTRFTPFDRKTKIAMVDERENDLYRSQLKVSDFVFGTADQGTIQSRIENNPKLKEVMEQLDSITQDNDNYGEWVSYVVLFGASPGEVKERVKRLKTVLENADFYLLWESVGLLEAYRNLMIGFSGKAIRGAQVNTTQAAALSLFYRSHEGIPSWDFGAKKEEAVYILESDDGVPFHYSPFVGDKCLVIGVGPTRSGKTFFKLCVATHFVKLGGMYCAMDIDEGSEPLARFFKEDSAVFCLKNTAETKGFNPFEMSFGKGDDVFVRHMMQLIRLMLDMNEAEELRSLDAIEQKEIEKAIELTMEKEGQLRSFSSMLGQCSPSVRSKLQKFKRGGIYGNLFDNDEDAIGMLDKPYSVYNTQGVKDSPELARLVNTEIFFRSVRLFEDPKYRVRAKFLEVDECQYVFANEGAAEFYIAKARTWFKHGGGMGFWTQSPKHYSELKEWSTLRSAATTFIFMSDPNMTSTEYIEAFPFLTETECQIIMNLKPKQQAYIKQMDKNIAKVVNLFVEDEQYVIATSRPHEAAIAKEIFEAEPDVDKAIDRIVEAVKR